MAPAQACEQALERLTARLAQVDPEARNKRAINRTVSVHVTDIDVTWEGRLQDGLLVDLDRASGEANRPRAQIRLSGASDDLIALIDGTLSFPLAWATGRCKVDASPMDLLRVRALL
jgi:hypothetical protein